MRTPLERLWVSYYTSIAGIVNVVKALASVIYFAPFP